MNDAGEWVPVVRSSTHALVVEAIEDRILSGDLTVGDLLPPERQLAENLGVSRAAAREAIRVLEGQGVLESHVGSGKRAGTFVAAMPSQALSRFLKLHVALSNFDLDEVVQTRVILEVASVRMAAENRSDPDRETVLAEMRDATAEMADRTASRAAFNDADTRFHIALARAGGNRLFADLTQAIRESLRIPNLRGFEGIVDWEGFSDLLRDQHGQILDAIEAGDADRAEAVVRAHIATASRTLPLTR
ncbi:FadR/GntR family transcriptional regulator [Corynebacterium nuruki]|uniref:FadR/GntR family transcriptional regulator n=2 Tax=Corynebacterium nuruki TaxID=1032851 RepID=UPI0039BF13C1